MYHIGINSCTVEFGPLYMGVAFTLLPYLESMPMNYQSQQILILSCCSSTPLQSQTNEEPPPKMSKEMKFFQSRHTTITHLAYIHLTVNKLVYFNSQAFHKTYNLSKDYDIILRWKVSRCNIIVWTIVTLSLSSCYIFVYLMIFCQHSCLFCFCSVIEVTVTSYILTFLQPKFWFQKLFPIFRFTLFLGRG